MSTNWAVLDVDGEVVIAQLTEAQARKTARELNRTRRTLSYRAAQGWVMR